MSVPEFNTTAPFDSAAKSERHPGRRAAAVAEQGTSAEIAALRQDWASGVPGATFREWDVPDEIFSRFVRGAESQFIEDTKQAALKFIHGLRSGQRRYEVAVTMAEATASSAYAKLTEAEKVAVKILIENQRQVKERP